MRSELDNLENIDKYLSGEMSTGDKAMFEAQMEADPALKSMVEDQQLFIQTVSRKALLAEINAVAGAAAVGTAAAGSAGFFGNTFWIMSSIVVVAGAATVGAIYLNQDDENEVAKNEIVVTENLQNLEDVSNDPETMTYGKVPSEDGAADHDTHSITEIADRSESNDQSTANSSATSSDESGNSNSGNEGVGSDQRTVAQHSSQNMGSTASGTPKRGDAQVENRPKKLVPNIRRSEGVSFDGGSDAMYTFLDKELTYPGTAKKMGLEAKVKVKFFVDAEGKLDLVEVNCVSMNYNKGSQEPLSGAQMAFKRNEKKDFETKVRHVMNVMSGKESWLPATDMYGNPVNSELQVWFFRFDLDDGIQFYNSNDL